MFHFKKWFFVVVLCSVQFYSQQLVAAELSVIEPKVCLPEDKIEKLFQTNDVNGLFYLLKDEIVPFPELHEGFETKYLQRAVEMRRDASSPQDPRYTGASPRPHLECLDLSQRKALKQGDQCTLLHVAAELGRTNRNENSFLCAVRYLLDKAPILFFQLAYGDRTALHCAILNGQDKIACELAGHDPRIVAYKMHVLWLPLLTFPHLDHLPRKDFIEAVEKLDLTQSDELTALELAKLHRKTYPMRSFIESVESPGFAGYLKDWVELGEEKIKVIKMLGRMLLKRVEMEQPADIERLAEIDQPADIERLAEIDRIGALFVEWVHSPDFAEYLQNPAAVGEEKYNEIRRRLTNLPN